MVQKTADNNPVGRIPRTVKWAYGLAIAIVSAAAASVFAYFEEDIAVRVASVALQGDLHGKWYMESLHYEYSDTGPEKLVRANKPIIIQQLNFRVIGAISGKNRHWRVSGYYNQPFLALSDVSASGTSGLGSFTGRAIADGHLAFLGGKINVECRKSRLTPVLLKCPAFLVRENQRHLVSKYESELRSEKCEEIASERSIPAKQCHLSTSSMPVLGKTK